ILKELSNEQLAVDVEDAARLNVAAVAVQVFIGGEFETQSVQNLTRLVDLGLRVGIPTLGVTAVGKSMTRDARYFRLATRICAELGAHFVKTYYVEQGFETVTASCPVPIVMAGGKKLPELDALTMAYRAVSEGAAGADLARLDGTGVPLLHFDVMDGCFTPMMTIGPPLVKAVRTPLWKDVHLMIEEPLEKLGDYVAAGADVVTVHAESCTHVHRVLQRLGTMENANDPARGIVRGLALNPGTPLEVLEPLLDELDLVHLLAINPGWGGQKFLPATIG